jgi:hypothetical protein
LACQCSTSNIEAQIGSFVPGHPVEGRDLAIAEPRRGVVQGLGDLIPTTQVRTEGIRENDIVAMGQECLHWLGVPSGELIGRPVILLNHLLKVHVRHLTIVF